MKNIRKILRIIWIICGLSFTIVLIISFQAKGVDKTLLQSSDSVNIVNDSYKIEFTPLKSIKDSALIFYPGGFVDPKAYVPMARKITDNGYKVIIVKLPLRIAFSNSQKQELFFRSKELIQNDDEINHWVMAGHSRGGALAAEFVKDESKLVDSLILIGTTHPKEFDLSDLKIDVTKVFATNDGLASEKEVFHPLEMKVLDHIIIGGTGYTSMAEKGIVPYQSKGTANYKENALGPIPVEEKRNRFKHTHSR